MLPAFKGRINRKTFLLGNIIGLVILGVAGVVYILPLALIDLVIGKPSVSSIFKYIYALFIIPAIFYFFFFATLFVKRMHDIGYPGIMLLWSFIFLELLARLKDIWILNIIVLIILLGICALPGRKQRNNFGPKPHKKFKLDDIVVRF
jgi:uncharacterized membrane protein YhaH (DUF805 family)